MLNRYPPLPASPSPRGRSTTSRSIRSAITEPMSVGSVRTMAMSTETAKRLQQRPIIGVRTPSYSGMDLSAVSSRSSSPGASFPTVNKEEKLQKVFEAALENNDERNRAERDAKRELKAQSKRILKGEFVRGQTQRIPFVDEKEAYRQYVLSHSLFPNLYNQRMVMTELGAS